MKTEKLSLIYRWQPWFLCYFRPRAFILWTH